MKTKKKLLKKLEVRMRASAWIRAFLFILVLLPKNSKFDSLSVTYIDFFDYFRRVSWINIIYQRRSRSFIYTSSSMLYVLSEMSDNCIWGYELNEKISPSENSLTCLSLTIMCILEEISLWNVFIQKNEGIYIFINVTAELSKLWFYLYMHSKAISCPVPTNLKILKSYG